MSEIEIKPKGFALSTTMRKYLIDQIHSVFGYHQYKIKKLEIDITESKDSNTNNEVVCKMKIFQEGHTTIDSEIKTKDLRSAISLAMERANLKITRSACDERISRREQYNINT